MVAVRYNAIKYLDELRAAGMDEGLAKVIVQHEAEFTSDINIDNFATKQDIVIMIQEINILKKDVNAIKEDIRSIKEYLKALELRMTIKFGTIMLIGVGILGFILKN